MANYRATPTPADRAKAIIAVAAVHVALAAMVLSGQRIDQRTDGQTPMQVIDISLPPPPPPPVPKPKPEPKAERAAGAAGKRAEATPIVAPRSRIEIPAATPLPAAPVAGRGSANSAGNAALGTGLGAGGTGDGAGGGGSGAGGGIGVDARLLSGGLTRRDYRRLSRFAQGAGSAVLAIMINTDGRVAECSIRRSSGDPALDAALCAILQPRMSWSPARDRSGRPLKVGLYYTATWGRD